MFTKTYELPTGYSAFSSAISVLVLDPPSRAQTRAARRCGW